jgi:hypothetical protein
MFLFWSKPPSGASLSRSARELRITAHRALMRNSRALRSTAAGGFARLGNGLSAWGQTAQENKSLHLKSLLWCGVTRWWLGRRGCKLGTAFRDFR